jgi:protein TonB
LEASQPSGAPAPRKAHTIKPLPATLCASALLHIGVFLFVPGLPGKTEKQTPPRQTFSLINLSAVPQILEEKTTPRPARPQPPLPERRDNSRTNSMDGTIQETADETLAASFELPPAGESENANAETETAVYGPAARADFLAAYAGTIRGLIDRRKEYPYQARRQEQEGTVEVRFAVSRNGLLSGDPVAEKKCRHPRLNAAALEAVRNAQPYPAFPPEIPDAELSFVIAISFSLK